MIAQERIDSAKSVSLIELLQAKGITVEKRGHQYIARCPFHEDQNPSFSIDASTNLFKCFGCGASGDAIRFVELLEKKSFPKAVSALVSVPSSESRVKKDESRVQSPESKVTRDVNPLELLNRVTEFYHTALLKEEKPREYLAGRGLADPELYKLFKLGHADGKLLATLPEAGPVVEALKKIGILTAKGQELFHGYVTFPLLDADGNTVGMYGRKIGDTGKVHHLYLPGPRRGLCNRQAAATAETVVLTESIIDALSLHQNGFPNAIPLYGTNGLTEDHLALFQSARPKRILLCLDNDEAGRKAAGEITEKLKVLGFQVNIIELPGAKDVNEYFMAGGSAGEFARLIATGRDDGESGGCVTEETELGLVVTCGDRQYRIRGISLHGFDRLRVNIRATHEGKYHLDTLDLYQSKARRYFAASLVKVLGLEPQTAEADLLRLIEEIEAHQAKVAAKEREPERKAPAMTKEREAEALAMLKDPELIQKILSDLEALGHVGEETNKILAYLIAVSRKLPKPLSGIVISGSGAGKSGLIEAVQELVPPEEVEFFSRVTPQALYYMDRDALKRKLLIIEERTGGEGADYSIRTLQTRQKLTQAVPIKDPNTGKIRTMTFEVEGPIAYLETTTGPEIAHENATRCFELYLDESPAQTRRIHEAQRAAKTGEGLGRKLQAEAIKTRHQDMQRLLEPVMVEIPYAPLLDFPADSLRTRRDHERFLSLIEAVTFLFQKQRERREAITPFHPSNFTLQTSPEGGGVACVLSTIDDYAIAYGLAREILGFTLDDLKKHARDLLDLIREMVRKKSAETGETEEEISFTRREIREHTGWPDYQVKNYIRQLEDLEYLTVMQVKKGGQFEYCLHCPDERRPIKGLLAPGELEKLLSTQTPSSKTGTGGTNALSTSQSQQRRVSVKGG